MIELTKEQVAAIESYICCVIRCMAKNGSHESNARSVLDSRKRLEKVFGAKLPVEYPDLLELAPPVLPDIL